MDGATAIRRGLVFYFGWSAGEANAARVFKSTGRDGIGWYVLPSDYDRSFFVGASVREALAGMKEWAKTGGVRG